VTDLCPREIDVLRLIAEGYDNRRIAETLHISIHTVKGYRITAKQKMGALNCYHLVTLGFRSGVLA